MKIFRFTLSGLALLLALGSCGTGGSPTAFDSIKPESVSTEAEIATKSVETTPDVSLLSGNQVRIMAANITSGPNQSYDPGEGIRIFQGLDPDIVLIQEFNYGNNSDSAIRTFINTAFGSSFNYYREGGNEQIPNGIVSKFPILQSGEWQDNFVSNRDYAWARIDVPGSKDLWAVSLHWLTTDSQRPSQANQLVDLVRANIPSGDYLVIGGDFNTDTRTETSLRTLGGVVITAEPQAVDQAGQAGTNASRSKPYDAVYVNSALQAKQIPVRVGSSSFPNGLVFDSRVFTPLSAVAPVQQGDSGAQNMQHMAVIKDFDFGGVSPSPSPTANPSPSPTVNPSPTTSPTPSIGVPQTINGSLAATDGNNPTRTGKYKDDYRLTGVSAGQVIQIDLNSSAFDAYLQLVNASTGAVITFNDDLSRSTQNSRISFTVQSGVTYLVRVTSYDSAATGSYSVITSSQGGSTPTPSPSPTPGSSPTPTPSIPTLTVGGSILSGSLATSDPRNPTRSNTYSDDYRLAGATTGRSVTLDLRSTNFDTYLQLVNASTGAVITANDDGPGGGTNSLITFTVQSGITYTVRVTSYNQNTTGGYTLSAR
jgi:endonuclease/exonuclease/phosphatase family metal-dependent hydrolase